MTNNPTALQRVPVTLTQILACPRRARDSQHLGMKIFDIRSREEAVNGTNMHVPTMVSAVSQLFTQDSIHAIVPLRYCGVQPRCSVPVGKAVLLNHSES